MIILDKKRVFSEKWIEILQEIAEFRRTSHSHWIWFRGHSSDTYTLDSGLFRAKENGEYLPLDYYLKHEYLLIQSFENNSASIITTKGNSTWEAVFQMQHHGLKTRLLDWTESLSTALYFAFNEWKYNNNENAEIWILDPYALNEYLIEDPTIQTVRSLKDRDFINAFDHGQPTSLNSFSIYPSKVNSRLLSQSAFFTVQGNKLLSLDQEVINQAGVDQKIVKRIELTPDLATDIYEYLVINGVNDFTVFNDADGLSKSLNKDIIDRLFDPKLDGIVRFQKNENYRN
ncbi:FRG domain-containing protein [Bacillus cereus]|nr:FRG domain-containing protein [Bacillus cereus]PGU53267.1 FRG domain-containing protein [Bacillus cereus]